MKRSASWKSSNFDSESESSSVYSDSDLDIPFIPPQTPFFSHSLPIAKCHFGIQVFVINVDQGNFICVKNCYKNKIVIIDAGSSNLKFEDLAPNSLNYIFKDCTISAIIITHLDKDHYNYLEQTEFKDFLTMNGVNSLNVIMLCGMSNPNQRTLLAKVKIPLKIKYNIIPKHRECIIQNITNNETITAADITEIEKQINDAFGYPNAFTFCLPTRGVEGPLSKNTCSLVVQLSCEGRNILFTGDATKATFNALSKNPKNVEIFRNTNFFVIPHHGANTAGSDEWLPSIVTYAKKNFVGAVVSANPIHTRHAHPRAISVKKIFDKSAQRHVKTPLLFHCNRSSGVYSTRTHRCIYEPALLPGNILWIKLENGLSIFDNDTFVKYSKPHESISPFFTPFTTFWNDGHFFDKHPKCYCRSGDHPMNKQKHIRYLLVIG